MICRIFLAAFVLVLSSLPSFVSAQVKDTVFSFTLPEPCKTSAGIFKNDSILVRTVWSGVSYSAGTHLFKWDGKNDFGGTLPDGKYTAKVLSNNVQYNWEGVIGNTSTSLSGDSKLRFFSPFAGMAVAGNYIYWAASYNEGSPSQYKTTISNPNSKIWIKPEHGTNQATQFVCSDGVKVYWAGEDPFDEDHETFVFATSVLDDSPATFSLGVQASMKYGSIYNSVVGHKRTPRSIASSITGIAVQSKGNFLIVSRKGLNELMVINRITGQLVQLLSMDNPSAVKIDVDDNLWLAYNDKVEKFRINNDGTLSTLGINITISKAGAIAISPDNSTVSICDIAAGKVKSYSVLTGTFMWELGRDENYTSSSTVYDDKFFWKDINKEYTSFLSYMPDGTFYVGDSQNRRVQHFSADRQYIDNIMYQSATYNTALDPKDPTRLYADYYEFKIDYSKPLQNKNGSWKLIRNWGGNVSSEFDSFEKIKFITTFSNGRTYGRLRLKFNYYLVELVENGTLRLINNPLPQFTIIGNDGSKLISNNPELGKPGFIKKYPVIGYDLLNNPIWSDTPETLASIPTATGKDPILWDGLKSDQVTSTNKIIFFDSDRSSNGRGEGYHLGAIQRNGNQWLWGTAMNIPTQYSGPFPKDGTFDSGNSVVYAGGTVLVNERDILWNYHGEFWKGSQTNIWNHVYDNGLFVGQFGELKIDHRDVEAYPGYAGNVFSGSLIRMNGDIYLYHNDESVHGGIHRWKISGLNTVMVQVAQPSTNALPKIEGSNLLEGLVKGESLKNGSGWERTPLSDYFSGWEDNFRARIGDKSYDIFKDPDLYIKYRKSSGSTEVARALGSNSGLVEWKLWGKINFEEHSPNDPNGGLYIEVLDKNNRIISRFSVDRDNISGTNIMGNGQKIRHFSINEFHKFQNSNQPFQISAKNGMITIRYTNELELNTTIRVDPTADWQSPTKLRFHFITKVVTDNYDRAVDIAELRFSKKTALDPISVNKATQTILFSNTPTSTSGSAPITLNAIASSGLSVTYSILSGPGTISGNILTYSGFGTVVVQATQIGNDAFEPATNTLSITRQAKTSQTLVFSNQVTTVTNSAPITVMAVASSGLPVTYSIVSGPANLSGNILNFTGPGTVVVQASQSGNDIFEPATATLSIAQQIRAIQTIVFNNPVTTVSGATPLTLNASASSGLPVTYSILSGPGSINGNVLNFTGVGTVVVQAIQTGNNEFEMAIATLSISQQTKLTQTIIFNNPISTGSGTAPLTLTAVASSGLPVTYSVLSGPGNISGNVLSFTGIGSVVVEVAQAGNSAYEATKVTLSISRQAKTIQTVSFNNPITTFTGNTPITLSAVASSGLPVSYNVLSGPGAIIGDVLTFSGFGTVVVQASQPGNNSYEAASATLSITRQPKTTQTIVFNNSTTVSGTAQTTLTAVASSGLPVTYQVLSGPGSISGNILIFTGTGTVVVKAIQAGNNAFEPASATLSFTQQAKIPQTIVFNNPTNISGGQVTLTAVASSGLPVSYSIISGSGNLTGNVLNFTGTGTLVVQATQTGNDLFEQAKATLSITNTSKISQTVTITSADKASAGTPLNLTAVASSGLPVSFTIVSGPGTITNNILTFTGNGSVTVQASQAGNNVYGQASATMKIDISSKTKANQSIKFSNLQNEVYGNSTVELTPIASSGLPVTLEVISGEAYITGNVLTFTAYGPVTIKATQPGNDEIEAVTVTTVVTNKPKPEIKVYPNPVVDNNINVKFDNVPKGVYKARLINLAGQTVFTTSLSHSGESANYKMSINQPISPGMCVLEISGYEVVFKQKILKN
jgi:hypothetical protein